MLSIAGKPTGFAEPVQHPSSPRLGTLRDHDRRPAVHVHSWHLIQGVERTPEIDPFFLLRAWLSIICVLGGDEKRFDDVVVVTATMR